jgi:hypothetical protein
MDFKHNCLGPAIEKTTGEFKIVNHKDKSYMTIMTSIQMIL